MNNKQKYKLFCASQSSMPIFMQDWWMDAACGAAHWDVLLYEEKGVVLASWVYHLKTKLGFKLVVQPTLTQLSGVWIAYPSDQKLEKRYSFENRLMNALIASFEALRVDYFEQNFHHSFKNWQPFHWKAYEQTTRYTYVLEDICDVDALLAGFSGKKRRKPLQKAAEGLTLDLTMSAAEFYTFYANSLRQKRQTIYYSEVAFVQLHKACTNQQQGQIFALKDQHGKIHAALFVVWDKSSAYNLVIAIDPSFRSSGASTRIVYEAILYLKNKTKNYDFEGSMIEGVALKNQSFGATQVPYFSLSKSKSKFLKFLLQLKKR